MKLDHLSASRIKTFKQCQMQYYARYELGIKDDCPHPLTVMGSAFHKMFEISTRARVLGNHEALQDPNHLIDSVMSKYKVARILRPTIVELTKNAVDWGYFRNVSDTIGCEVGFSEKISDGTNVVGFIDRLDINGNKAEIIDLKTQKKKFSDKELSDNWQADIYNWAVRKMFPQITEDVIVSFWVVRHQVQRISRSKLDAEKTENSLLDVAKEIRECDSPTMNPSYLCRWCPYESKCPSVRQSLKEQTKGLF